MNKMKKPKPNQERERERIAQLGNTSYQPSRPSRQPVEVKTTWSWRRRLMVGFISIIAVVLVLFIAILVWNIRNFSAFSQTMFGSSSIFEVYPSRPLQTDSAGRTNILILGTASDRPDHGGSELTDTILLVSFDASGDGYMLSLPRDLYVTIPGYTPARLNEAYAIGERNDFNQAGYASGGIGLTQKTVEEVIGIETHYHVVVSFQAVELIVDALDGVTVDIDSPDDRGLYDPNFRDFEGGPLRLDNGTQEIDGQTALRLSRARGSTGQGYGFPESDFNRTRNQQEVFQAILAELDWRVVLDPRTNQRLLDAIAATTQTDVDLDELLSLYRLLVATSPEALQSYTLRDIERQNVLTSYTSPAGGAVLIPVSGLDNFTALREAVRSIHQ